jgi:hypothetical protein
MFVPSRGCHGVGWVSFVSGIERSNNNRIPWQSQQEKKSGMEKSVFCRKLEGELVDDIWYTQQMVSKMHQ